MLLIAASAAAVFALITLGGIVRVTESGLGCPDWPLCNGKILPPLEYHALIEYSHRTVASLVGFLVILTTIVAWWKARKVRWVILPLSAAVPLVGLAGLLGRNAVLSDLAPEIVTAHLAIAQIIFALVLAPLLWYWATTKSAHGRQSPRGSRKSTLEVPDRFGPLVLLTFPAIFITLLTGSYVVGEGAGTACPSWPFCDSGLIPNVSIGWLHMAHRVIAAIFGLFVGFVAYLGWQKRSASKIVGRTSAVLIFLLLLQIVVGAANPWLDFTPEIRAAHLSIATAIWGCVIALAIFSRKAELWELSSKTKLALQIIEDYISLTKPRIVVLLLITALGGMYLAEGGTPPLSLVLLVMVGGALGSGGAQAINHSLDKDIDQLMHRTQNRPVAGDRVSYRAAVIFGIILNAAAFMILFTGVNLLAATLTLSATLFYVVIYTGWLKRSTTQNIVIGGAAGAVPPMVGWVAITGSLGLPPLYLFAIIFFWTPPHFWALALLIKDDYARAGVPMLPVVQGNAATAKSVMLHTIILVSLTILFYTTEAVGEIYFAGAICLGIPFVILAWKLLRAHGDSGAKPLYLYSLAYLAGIFLLLMVDSSMSL
ncbi:MAG: protoheme IX farnesyltransferase [SAR202 cluster bacterium Io17-Chloro-G3]|nr:MAG: protoheme IX farnesyltransferase [SAR202 cluster bacterium Io17-Chloro-G3]